MRSSTARPTGARAAHTWATSALTADLFSGFDADELRRVTDCLGMRVRTFARGETLLASGERPRSVTLVLDGTVYASRLDEHGSRDLVAAIGMGEVFGENVLSEPDGASRVTVTGAVPGEVLELGMDKIVDPGGPLCELRSRVVENLLRIMAVRTRRLGAKLELLGTRSLRERIARFLHEEQECAGSPQFTIVFSRAELADYLGADRAALSRELARMKAAGLIDYHRNSFAVLGPAWSTSR